MNLKHDGSRKKGLVLGTALGAIALMMSLGGVARAQVPPDIEAQLVKIGHIVDPPCTAKIYRPLQPKNDFNTYWPPDAPAPVFKGELYPGVTIMRDTSFGPDPKDVLDIFVGDKGPANNRPILIFVPGGVGNKIEQQDREANAFYDNIARWATENGMIGVTVQRHAHPGGAWDDTGRDIAMAVDYVYDHAKEFHGDQNRMFIWAHSAGNGPTSMYVGHPDRWPHGVRVIGAIFNSGNPVGTAPGAAPAGGGRGNGGGPGGGAAAGGGGGGRGAGGGGGGAFGGGGNAAGSTCGLPPTAMNATDGRISGPSGMAPAPAGGAGGGRGAGGGGAAAGGPGGGAAAGGGGGRGAGGGRGGRAQLTPEEQAERDNWPGFKASPVKMMLAWGELDIGVMDNKFPAGVVTLHDDMCMLDGPNAKDGTGHCPKLVLYKGESHMSEVFSPDTKDKTVTTQVLAFIKGVK